ncbi:hypothetical protein B7494_g1994 [Chlorociboria aeruginascens]|nr:hypothetical protein B7494_g1994 [Chlorociboria aeruginascens]
MSLKLGNKEVGPIAFGLMGLTARAKPTSYDEAVKTMKAALENGSNLWNGGEFYGPPNANSLQLLNCYFTKYPEDKDRVYLSMKGAFSFEPLGPDNSPENIRRSIDTCLHLLDDKVFIENWEPARADPKVPVETTIKTIAEYVNAGKIGSIGLSECNANTIRRAHAVHPITSVEVELSIFTTDPLTNGIASTCAELDITILAYAPLSQGFLTGQIKTLDDIPEGDMRRNFPRFQPGVFDQNLKLVDKVREIAQQKGCTMAQIAIGWVSTLSQNPGMPRIIPLPGATTVERVQENSKHILLDTQEMTAIDEILAKMPVQGHRWPDWLEKFADK